AACESARALRSIFADFSAFDRARARNAQSSHMSAGLYSQPPKWIRFFPVAAAAVAVLTGSAALIGWFEASTFLKNISPQFVSLKANEALALIMLGAALAIAAFAPPRPLRWLRTALELAA